MPEQIGIRELKNRATHILRSVREEMAEYIITLHGEAIAILRPLTQEEIDELRQTRVDESLSELKALSEQVAAAWISEKSGLELISEQRR